MITNQPRRHGQQGLSMLVVLMALALGVLALTALVRIVPVYIDDLTLGQIFGGLEDPDVIRDLETVRDVRSRIKKRVGLEDLSGVDVREMTITINDGFLVIDYAYEVRTPFMGNIDAVIKFEHHREMRLQ